MAPTCSRLLQRPPCFPATAGADHQMQSRRRISVRRSPIHGKGVFATVTILRGELICEYKGKRVPWEAAMARPPRDLAQPEHTFLFDIGDGCVIDGAVGGNSARWINHSCNPNCVPELDGQKIFIRGAEWRDALLQRLDEFVDHAVVMIDEAELRFAQAKDPDPAAVPQSILDV